ncbi:MAG: anti-sigma factor [Bacteroidetes bacterium]|nr:anti-sigma factor [Bacteroidota bacterium]
MDIRAIIESGELELYVMDRLPAAETAQIDKLRVAHSELNEEIRRIEDTLIAFATAQAIRPSANLKNKIAAQLNFADEPAQTVTPNTTAPETKVITMVPPAYRFMAAASVALIIGLGASTFYYYSKYNEANSNLLAMRTEQNVLANQVKYQKEQSEAMQQQLAVVSDPTNKAIVLKGLPIAPNAQAVVYWNNETGKAYINSTNLPALAANEQYQLWAIVDGKPVDMGVVDKDSVFNIAKDVKGAVAFAITVEPLGGKATPTLEKMYVLGNVTI